MELKQHPLSAAFPAMSADDFAALVEDVRANGQREPIMLFEGMVLDGWHRYRACVQVGIKPTQFPFPDGKDPVAFVLSQNLHRRHLTPSQRAAAVVACAEWAPKGRPGKAETISGFREKDMAKAAGTSDRTIRDAKVAHKAGLGEAVKAGALTAHEAATVARGKPAEKPAPKAKSEKRELPAAPPPTAPELDEAQDTIAELAQENEQLRDRLAVEAMDASEEEKTQAAETIRELRERVRLLEIEVEALKASRDTYMRESSEKTAQINYWRKEAKKAGAVA
jgi:FtsZ-binding cell division protein ZapB